MSGPRFDPRAKLALAIGFVLAAFLSGSVSGQVVLLGLFAVLVGLLGEVSLREWVGALVPLSVLVFLILVLNTIFYASGPAWVSVPTASGRRSSSTRRQPHWPSVR